MSMIEVLASNFHQNFGFLEGTAKAEIARLIGSVSSKRDRQLLKHDIEMLLKFKTYKDMAHYLCICGASYWPPDEDIADAFREALTKPQSEIVAPTGPPTQP